MKWLFSLAAVALLSLNGTAIAGQITGEVIHKDKSKASGVRVSGETSDGMVRAVVTDAKGQFTLTWSTNKKLIKVFLNGDRAATDVADGSNITLVLK
jgi:outer membrane lipoprotein SlyB